MPTANISGIIRGGLRSIMNSEIPSTDKYEKPLIWTFMSGLYCRNRSTGSLYSCIMQGYNWASILSTCPKISNRKGILYINGRLNWMAGNYWRCVNHIVTLRYLLGPNGPDMFEFRSSPVHTCWHLLDFETVPSFQACTGSIVPREILRILWRYTPP